MQRFIPLLFLALSPACATEQSEDPAVREHALASKDVWHEAKLRGAAFRAIGQEPAWLLEITNGREILIVTNYGQDRVSHPYVEPEEDKAAARSVFQIDAETSVLIEGKPCTDSMSGESFDVTVTVTSGAQTLEGCGRALF